MLSGSKTGNRYLLIQADYSDTGQTSQPDHDIDTTALGSDPYRVPDDLLYSGNGNYH
jgi:hypothetical protein